MLELLKDMKKIAEDAKTVTMKHPSGHTIVLITKKLPVIQKEALKRLPLYDGGEVGVHKSEYEKPAKEIKNKYEKHNAGESKAGEYAKKSSESKGFNKQLSKEESVREHHEVLGQMQTMPKPKLQGLADGGSVDSDTQKPDQPPVVVNVGQPQSPAAGQAATQIPVSQPNVQQTNPNVLLQNGSMSAPGAAETAQQAVQGQQAIDTAKAQAQVPIEQARLQAEQDFAQQQQNNINALKTHADNLASNIKDIDPDAYRKNLSAPAKVATGIGLFLGGFSVPFSGHNFAADFLNRNIDRDISAQMANQGKQKTIFDAYNSLYNNQTVAANMTKASMADIYKDQIDQAAAKLGTPQAAVNAQKLKSDLAITKNKAILDAAGNLSSLPNNPTKATQLPDQESPSQQMSTNAMAPTRSHGEPSAEASTQPKLIPKDPYADSGILAPDAQEKLDQLRYTPKAKDEIDQIKQQYNQAQMADTLLGQLHDLHQNLYKDAQAGGGSGYFRRHDPTSAIPVVGEALSRTFVQPATATPVNKEYDSLKTRITGDIANALRGTNISGEEIAHIVNANSPEPNDPPELVEKKERAIRLFLKNSINKSLLKDWKLIK